MLIYIQQRHTVLRGICKMDRTCLSSLFALVSDIESCNRKNINVQNCYSSGNEKNPTYPMEKQGLVAFQYFLLAKCFKAHTKR